MSSNVMKYYLIVLVNDVYVEGSFIFVNIFESIQTVRQRRPSEASVRPPPPRPPENQHLFTDTLHQNIFIGVRASVHDTMYI